jgi:hypothetical protein
VVTSSRGGIGIDIEFRQLYKIAGVCAAIIAVLIPIQAFIFIAFPPPSTVIGYFELFQKHKILGLLDLDLLLSLDNLLTIVIFLGLYNVMKRTNRSLVTIAIAFSLIGIVLYLVSREATFSMLMLSNQYAAATSEVQKATLLAAGQTMLTVFNGSAFDISYVMGGIAILIISIVMTRNEFLGKAIAYVGIITGILMLLPPTVGTVGLYVSMLSLLPTLVWLVMLSIRFIRLGKADVVEPKENKP